MTLIFTNFIKFLKESVRDLTPIILVIIFFQIVVIQTVPENWEETTL
jgi:hypothetical protein